MLVVTVFGGVPPMDAPLSPFARSLHARWEYPADAALKRQEEDLAALALLGAEAIHWPYTDCIYRQAPDGRFLYDSEESLWGVVNDAEHGLVAELAARLAALSGSQLCAPLGVGHHVDHQFVRRAAEACRCALIYYADYPYARDPQAVQSALREGEWWSGQAMLSEQAWAAKIAAVACYRSQLSTFWTSEAEMATAIRAFAEQYWVKSLMSAQSMPSVTSVFV